MAAQTQTGGDTAMVNLADLSASDPKVKYGVARNLLALSAANPAAFYPQLETFISLLDNKNNILRWTAIDVIGHLAAADRDNRIDPLVTRLIKMLSAGNLITANHAIS